METKELYEIGFLEGYDLAKADLKETGNWIDIKDSLPEKDKDYQLRSIDVLVLLVYDGDSDTRIAFHMDDLGWFDTASRLTLTNYPIRYWTYLPYVDPKLLQIGEE